MVKTIGDEIKIKDLPEGMIIWVKSQQEYDILGITQCTLPDEFEDCYCLKIEGNRFDYILVGDE